MDFEMRILVLVCRLPILIKVLSELSLGEWQRVVSDHVCLFVRFAH